MPRPRKSTALQTSGPPANEGSLEGKSHRALVALMGEISRCRADILRRENLVADLQRRLLAELKPLEEKILDLRVETFRILGAHLQSGRLNRRAAKELELALLDLANELEREYGLDLREERNRFFEEEFPPGQDEEDRFLADGTAEAEADEWGNRFGEKEGGFGKAGKAHSWGDSESSREGGGFSRGRPEEGDAQGRRQAGPRSKSRQKQDLRDESIAGDVRALYLMLARALHPDKESDPAKVAEKTAWMQKVTAAYAARDLARLLDILAANPLDAVGPYLSQAPLKTVQGFAKRLRRELDALRTRLADLDWKLDPFLTAFIKGGKVNEIAYNTHLSATRKELKFRKQRRDAYRTTEGLHGLLEALKAYGWRELM